jgi:hypothetical protein
MHLSFAAEIDRVDTLEDSFVTGLRVLVFKSGLVSKGLLEGESKLDSVTNVLIADRGLRRDRVCEDL